MNKLNKIGLSALCGSLAAISVANAGALDVSGGATMTHTTTSKTDTGNPFGMASNLTFSASGELDGGQTFALSIANSDQNVYSTSSITLTTNSLGVFKIDQAGGGAGVGGYDDNMPTAWEEVLGHGMTVGADLTKGVGSSTNVSWTSPSAAGATLQVAYTPRNDGVKNNDKAVSGAVGVKGAGYDIVLDASPTAADGKVNFFVGYSISELGDGRVAAGNKNTANDHEEGTAGIKLTFGPVTGGFQRTIEATAAEVAGSTEYYANTSWGVSFNVKDNRSASYGKFISKKGFTAATDNESRRIEAESWQIAYTVGGASIKIADSEVDNAQYVTGSGNDRDATTIALTLAF